MSARMCRMCEAASHKLCVSPQVLSPSLKRLGTKVVLDGMQAQTCEELDSYGREGKLPIFGWSL